MSKGDLNVVDKGKKDFDPQTEADRKCQQLIVGSLLTQYKNLTIIGEEGVTDMSTVPLDLMLNDINEEFLKNHKCPESLAKINEEDLVIWVDPLDGKLNFLNNFLNFNN